MMKGYTVFIFNTVMMQKRFPCGFWGGGSSKNICYKHWPPYSSLNEQGSQYFVSEDLTSQESIVIPRRKRWQCQLHWSKEIECGASQSKLPDLLFGCVKQAGPQRSHLRGSRAGFNTFAILKFLVIFEQGACNFLFNWASQIITELRNIVPFTWWTQVKKLDSMSKWGTEFQQKSRPE